jgi:hypothetical protein
LDDEVSTESGSDRVSIDLKVEIARIVTRSLPLSVLTPSSATAQGAGFSFDGNAFGKIGSWCRMTTGLLKYSRAHAPQPGLPNPKSQKSQA